MKRQGLLNAPLSGHIARLGHTQTLVIADAGLPIPADIPCVDLAVIPGLPAMLPVLDALLAELCIEAVTHASELALKSPELHDALSTRLASLEQRDAKPLERHVIEHVELKLLFCGEV